MSSEKVKVIDLFCGAGVGAIGIIDADCEIVYACDTSKFAVENYNHNHNHEAVVANVRTLNPLDIPYGDIIVGGFPCKSFSIGSHVAKGFDDKDTGDLAFHFYRFVKSLMPLGFVIENVSAITRDKFKEDLTSLKQAFKDLGYRIEDKLLDCYDYGVPQNRKRFFIVGTRADAEINYRFPDPVPENEKKTLRDAIYDIKDKMCELPNHCEHHDVMDHSPRFRGMNRQRQWDQPAFTVVSDTRNICMYPDPPNYNISKEEVLDKSKMPRRFTPRENLRLQTVPDSFEFIKGSSLTMQYKRCSGIPPLMMRKLIEPLRDGIIEYKGRNPVPELSVDKELENFITPLARRQRNSLALDIYENGCRDSIILWKDKNVIVDGHNRYRICQERNFKFNVIEQDFSDIEQVKSFMISNQITRRNLNSFEQVELLKRMFERKKEDNPFIKKSLYKEISDNANISHDTVQRCLFILSNANDEDKTILRKGEASINSIYVKCKQKNKIAKSLEIEISPGDILSIYDSTLVVGEDVESIKRMILRSKTKFDKQ